MKSIMLVLGIWMLIGSMHSSGHMWMTIILAALGGILLSLSKD